MKYRVTYDIRVERRYQTDPSARWGYEQHSVVIEADTAKAACDFIKTQYVKGWNALYRRGAGLTRKQVDCIVHHPYHVKATKLKGDDNGCQ